MKKFAKEKIDAVKITKPIIEKKSLSLLQKCFQNWKNVI